MKRILIILLLCVGSFIHAQEYQLSEIEHIKKQELSNISIK